MLKFPALASMHVTKIPASFVIAEAALESGWGKSDLVAKAMNIWGVKADASWHGDILTMNTREFIDGEWVMVPAKWRKYASWQECLDDHAKFLLTNPRYKSCFDHTDGIGFAQAVAKAGYATDPQYAQKLTSIITGNHLSELDTSNAPVAPTAGGLVDPHVTTLPVAPAPSHVLPPIIGAGTVAATKVNASSMEAHAGVGSSTFKHH